MSNFRFSAINPLLHNELRLKIMVALDSVSKLDFMYLCDITEATRGNVSIQLKLLRDAGYINLIKTGSGCTSHTLCNITDQGHDALYAYEIGLQELFAQKVPEQAYPDSIEEQKQIG